MSISTCPGILLERLASGEFRTVISHENTHQVFLPSLRKRFSFSRERVPISAACAGFSAQVREASILACRDCLHVTEDNAVAAGVSTVCMVEDNHYIHLKNSSSEAKSSPSKEGRKNNRSLDNLSRPMEQGKKGDYRRNEKAGGDCQTRGLFRGAVFRATCLVAGHGLLDPAGGPRAAAESLAMSLLFQSDGPLPPISSAGGSDHLPSVAAAAASTIADNPSDSTDSPSVPRKVGLQQQNPRNQPSHHHCEDFGRGGPQNNAGKDGIRTAKATPVAPPGGVVEGAACLRLRDKRWGVEVLLACVAMDIASEAEVVAGPPKNLNNVLAAEANGERVNDLRRGGNRGLDHYRPMVGAVKRAARAQAAYNIVESACRKSHIGPALVASILLTWIPRLLPQVERQQSSTNEFTVPVYKTGSRDGALLQPHLREACSGNPRLLPTRNSRVKHAAAYRTDTWQYSITGERETAEALVVGAIRMLLFMVKSFRMIPLSDFSMEKLARVAEAGSNVGTPAVVGERGTVVRT